MDEASGEGDARVGVSGARDEDEGRAAAGVGEQVARTQKHRHKKKGGLKRKMGGNQWEAYNRARGSGPEGGESTAGGPSGGR